ncbi:MAG: twin arginine-targeting protein translocase TatC [Chloroflexi bacterium RBG_13_57_8]|nr:MAG: twin arginine-targeting protein translocase TatC [Chloroflexi bacterium RBG_13_57_8]
MSGEKKLTILGHFAELRGRLLKCLLAVVLTTTVSFIFARQIFQILILPAGGADLIFVEMTEMVGTYMKVCLTTGVIMAMPYITFQLLMFVSPALTRREKKYVHVILPCVGLMFIAGVIFGYFVLVPPGIRFLTTFGTDIATPQIRIGNYISLVTRLLLAIGFVFEMPVVTSFLTRIGVITPRWLAGKRKPAVILALVLAAIITPTFDPVNQLLVAVPLIVLYELSIWLARLVQRRAAPLVMPVSSPVS